MTRCSWCNLDNPLYVDYHDHEWGRPSTDEQYLYELLILETFQAGLSWECVLNKRETFREAYDHFDREKVGAYDEAKIQALLANPHIIRNKNKIKASVSNTRIFNEIVGQYGNFHDYLNYFAKNKILYEVGQTTNALSDTIARDLKKRGMKFVGSTTIYAYLQAIGMINSHERECFLYQAQSSPAAARR